MFRRKIIYFYHSNHKGPEHQILAAGILGKIPLDVFIEIQKRLFFQIGVLKNFTKFTEKDLSRSLFFLKNFFIRKPAPTQVFYLLNLLSF